MCLNISQKTFLFFFISPYQANEPSISCSTMPRDLFSSPSSDSPSPKELSLVASPESQTPTPAAIAKGFNNDNDDPQLEGESPGWENEDGSSGGRNHFLIRHEDSMKGTVAQLLRGRGAQQANHADDLHPFVQTLSLKDLESCVALEDACFEEHERESRETVRGHSVLYQPGSSCT